MVIGANIGYSQWLVCLSQTLALPHYIQYTHTVSEYTTIHKVIMWLIVSVVEAECMS